MAKVLDSFPHIPVTRKSKYPWEEWADGRVWELEQGKDFKGRTTSMKQTAEKFAGTHNLQLKRAVRREGDKEFLVVQFTEKGTRGRTRSRA